MVSRVVGVTPSRGGPAALPGKWDTALVYGLLFLSGAAALAFEISWTRQIGLLFGHTVQAAAIVLGSYFAGMAIGHALSARWGSHVSPLVGYGVAELVAAGWACLIPLLLVMLETGQIARLLNAPQLGVQTAVRAVISFALLLPATVAMGATLPLVAEYFSPAPRLETRRISIAYALNTLGAFVGVLATTGYLLVALGVRASSYLGAGVSTFCGLAAFAMVFRRRFREPLVATVVSTGAFTPPLNRRVTTLWTVVVALSGFATLGLEVLYMRLFALVFHNSSYTFGAVVAVFLAALAVGAAAVSLLHRRLSAIQLAASGSLLGSIGVVFSALAFTHMTRLEYFNFGDTFTGYMLGALGLVAVFALPPIAFLGVVLPAAWKAAANSAAGGAAIVGRLTAANTLAAMVGSLLASFWFLPALGLWRTFGLFSFISCLPAALLFLHRGRKYQALFLGLMIASLILVTNRRLDRFRAARVDEGEELVGHWETPYGWIDVVRSTSTQDLSLRENIHYRHGSTGLSTTPQYRLGHLPLLLHKDPRDVLFLGLGTGLTAGSALLHPEVEQVKIVELIPEVVEAARLFGDTNFNVVDDPKVKIYIDDARHHLLATNRKHDIIISDLFVPWVSQAGYLYTVEQFQAVSARLKRGGLFCLWLGLYQMGANDFDSIADSLASVFPETGVWWGQVSSAQAMVLLVGSAQPLELDGNTVNERLGRLHNSSQVSDIYLESAANLFRLFIGQWSVRFPDRLNTDEHPRVEFLSPINIHNAASLTLHTLSEYFDSVLAKLPQGAAQFRPVDGQVLETPEDKRAAARWILRRPINRPPSQSTGLPSSVKNHPN